MPCYDSRTSDLANAAAVIAGYGGGYSSPEVRYVESNRDKELTALLCSTCRVLTRLGYDFDENPALSVWWEAHKKEDAKRAKE